jgi:hypothetical protein
MSKVICDICGTQYPDTADQCPICGYARKIAGQPQYDSDIEAMLSERPEHPRTKGGKFSASNVRKRTQEENVPVMQPKKEKFRDNSYRHAKQESSPVLVVLLVILIMTLLATTAFIFFRYLLPNVTNTEVPTSTEQTQEQTGPDETEQLSDEIPCEALALTSGGTIIFTEEGQMSLLNEVIIPSDSTDKLVYASSDENVATVNDEGRVTAVGEGEAMITITCGKRQMQCNVICSFPTEATEDTSATDESAT